MKTILLNLALWAYFPLFSQNSFQYFDGANTNPTTSVLYSFDPSDTTNAWQVGPPQKQIFNAPASSPNVLITDTILHYPDNDTSHVIFKVSEFWTNWGILALQWMQKIDFDSTYNDGGIVEFSNDGGNTWENALYNPYVYNYFGFDQNNIQSIQGGQEGFAGSDTTWRNVWLCLDMSWLSQFADTIRFRFTFVSDSTDNDHEGWMVDNFVANITGVHTANELEQESYIKVAPNPVADKLYIQAEKKDEYHIIQDIYLQDSNGNIVREYHSCPTKFWVDVRDLAQGMYYLTVTTNFETDKRSITITH